MKAYISLIHLGLLPAAVGAFVIHPVSPPLCLPFSSLASASSPETVASLLSSPLYGGDFAGLSASFDGQDGTLIPLPEHFVPEALFEWGEGPPSCWEVIVSEEGELLRQTVRILPAVGCGIDNLETIKTIDALNVSSLQAGDGMTAFDSPMDGGITRAETTFQLADDHRLRVVLDVVFQNGKFSIGTPLHVSMERRVSSESSRGTIADGGGLTGSRISELLGAVLRKTPHFCDTKSLDWQPPGVAVLNLPGNITIATSFDGSSPWMLDIVYMAIDEKGEAEQLVVRRSYHAP